MMHADPGSAKLLLVRHAAIDGLGVRIPGRTPGISLNELGKVQAHCLARRLGRLPVSAVYSSPMERARQTADAVAAAMRLPLHVMQELDELDFGDWTGRSLRELQPLPEWQSFNASRNAAVIPGGENMLQLSRRAASAIAKIRAEHPLDCVVLISHADWIRAAVASQLSLPLDALRGFEIGPASVTILQVENGSARILRWNDTGDLNNVF
jgi:probable phosphoglycerate mutase